MQKIPLSTLALGSMAAMGALGTVSAQAEEQVAPTATQEAVVLTEAEMDEVTAGQNSARVQFDDLDFTVSAEGEDFALAAAYFVFYGIAYAY